MITVEILCPMLIVDLLVPSAYAAGLTDFSALDKTIQEELNVTVDEDQFSIMSPGSLEPTYFGFVPYNDGRINHMQSGSRAGPRIAT
jgi:hypothetical protein